MVRKILWGLVTVAILTSAVLYSSIFRLSENFHVVDPGQFYRSAQLLPYEIKDVAQKYHIRTIINLRGEQPKAWWYQQEKKTAAQLGIQLVDIPLSSKEVPSKDALLKLLSALHTAPRPILVHCRSGADRTSEASALYLMDVKGVPRAQALKQLSLGYLHVNMFAPAKKFLVEKFQGQYWAKNVYDPCRPEYRPYFDQKSYCH